MNLLARFLTVRYLLSCLRSVYYALIGVKSLKDAIKKSREKKKGIFCLVQFLSSKGVVQRHVDLL